MAIASGKTDWRNVVAWSAVGAGFCILAMWGAVWLIRGGAPDAILAAMLGSTASAVTLALTLAVSVATFGYSFRKRPFTLRTLRNSAISQLAMIAPLGLLGWGLVSLAKADMLTGSAWAAALTGAVVIAICCLGSLTVASVHTRTELVEDPGAAEDMRERTRLLLYSFAAMIACGLTLIVLALAGPAGAIAPATALIATLALVAVQAVLGVACWRLMDELDRTLSKECGNLTFYLIALIGGGWAMLGHLGFAIAPAPLDWLTLLTILMFAASFIVMGRRKLLRA